ncbi:ArsR/SmtB family transcription factor [Vibrio viridaestus]|uniref:ArsR family transcriptional regulator n=1 Tax=Vibrio viridaestus TaxID=2487322 RepID=A0A3N9TFE6_9VIBR|nr:metalloregulator ArsR/SmtB family transcription factor [Vibrio viridaestus]RQW62770.1 ArsR family transcriptional regulator [Vibrio viridaestus]
MIATYSYENASDLLKALAHENRLKIIELLSFGECCVEDLAYVMGASVKLISAHLRVMRTSGVLATRKEGVRVYYRLANSDVLELYNHVKEITQASSGVTSIVNGGEHSLTLKQFLAVFDGALLIDVRSEKDFSKGHIPGALNVPVEELYVWSQSYSNDDDKLIVVYCENVYCIQAIDAVQLLLEKKYKVKVYPNGLQEWQNAGYDVEL